MPKLLDRVRMAIRARHCSPRTSQAYVQWVRCFVRFHGLRHPDGLGLEDVNAFLTHLAVDRHVSPSTRNQAASGLTFLYREVLDRPTGRPADFVRAKKERSLPVVLTRAEIRSLLARLDGDVRTVALLPYGSGPRLNEALQLRIKDLDFERREIVVRRPKSTRDRVTVLPDVAVLPLRARLDRTRALWEHDRQCGGCRVELPDAFGRKAPHADRDWPWQSRLATLLRHPRPRGRIRHPNQPGAARAQEPHDDDDLHPRREAGRPRHPQPGRCGPSIPDRASRP